jgi:hypothetical protein
VRTAYANAREPRAALAALRAFASDVAALAPSGDSTPERDPICSTEADAHGEAAS